MKIVFKKHRGLGELGSWVMVIMFAIILLSAGSIFYSGVFAESSVSSVMLPNDSLVSNASYAFNSYNSTAASMGEKLKNSDSSNPVSLFFVLFTGVLDSIKLLFDVIRTSIMLTGSIGTAFNPALPLGWLFIMLGSVFMVFIVWRLVEGGSGREW